MTDHLDVTARTGIDTNQIGAADGGPARRGPDRRTMLKAAGLVGLGGGSAVLAACTSVEPPAAPATSPPPSSPASNPSAEVSSAEPSESEASASEESAPDGPSVDESSVPEGSGVILDDADFVVTQPTSGEFKAFSKICTHQNCAVAEVTQTIDCKCHGSRFSITDGSVVNGPASRPLAEARTTVSGGKVYVQA